MSKALRRAERKEEKKKGKRQIRDQKFRRDLKKSIVERISGVENFSSAQFVSLENHDEEEEEGIK
jgi:hypothetical protein